MAADSANDENLESIHVLGRKLDAVGWGLFFIWVGLAFLADLSWGAGLLGVGVITLGGQVARKYFGLPVERFWLLSGGIFAVWGVWNLLGVRLGEAPIPGGLIPLLFIVVGVLLVVSAFFRKAPR